jgi:hypothetical protein
LAALRTKGQGYRSADSGGSLPYPRRLHPRQQIGPMSARVCSETRGVYRREIRLTTATNRRSLRGIWPTLYPRPRVAGGRAHTSSIRRVSCLWRWAWRSAAERLRMAPTPYADGPVRWSPWVACCRSAPGRAQLDTGCAANGRGWPGAEWQVPRMLEKKLPFPNLGLAAVPDQSRL